MQNKYLSEISNFSDYTREELLEVIKELQQKYASLRSNQINQGTNDLAVGKVNFRQQYAEKILDALPDMLTVVTDEGSTVAIVSSEETNHSGISRDEIYGVNVSDFLPDHVYNHVMESIGQAKVHGISDNLNHQMIIDGKACYFENRTVKIADDLNLCLCRDITEEIQSKLQLESLSYAVDLVNESIFSLNPEGEFLFTNKQFKKDHALKNVIGKSAIGVLFSCFTQDDWDNLKKEIRENNGTYSYIVERIDSEKKRISYEIVAHSFRNINNEEEFWFFSRNVTLRLEQECKISDLSTLMKAILDNIPIYLSVKDSSDYKYLYWNKSLEQHSGIRAKDIIGKSDFEVFPDPNEAENIRRNDIELIHRNEKIEFVEDWTNCHKEKRTIKTIKVPIEREEMSPLIIIVSLDITDIKNAEQRLIDAKLDAEQSNRLKSAFLANMSHEIRTPLNAIVGFAKLIMQEDDKEAQKEYSDIIDRNADLLIQLINDILDLSKIEAGMLDFTIKEIDFDELCRDMLEVHRMKVSEKITISYQRAEGPLLVSSDRNRLAQVFTNLLSNAIKFTPSGTISFGYSIKKDMIEAYVRDTGMGISSDKLSTIFDRFVKLNNFVQGTGLGLSITQTIIEKLGGTISVQSEIGKGTEFTFTIPYSGN